MNRVNNALNRKDFDPNATWKSESSVLSRKTNGTDSPVSDRSPASTRKTASPISNGSLDSPLPRRKNEGGLFLVSFPLAGDEYVPPTRDHQEPQRPKAKKTKKKVATSAENDRFKTEEI
eukprot:m.350561 g.350561  ORF g.350561 m.350561 type:complete len:119 (+) comp48169_c0_seq1:3-359(+)